MARLIAIVEDEIVIRENYADALRNQGYEVETFATRRDALNAWSRRLPDLVVVDISLRDEDEAGYELCRELRTRSMTLPIILLSARDSELDTISGLRLGADDYLSKSVSLPHLMARIAALLRRIEAIVRAQDDSALLMRGSLRLDIDRLLALWNETPIPLTVTEFWIVYSLAKRIGHVKTREQLMQDANIAVDDSAVTSHVKRIRRKFEIVSDTFACIETIYGMGYRWVPER